jgi:hypothetical protein
MTRHPAVQVGALLLIGLALALPGRWGSPAACPIVAHPSGLEVGP